MHPDPQLVEMFRGVRQDSRSDPQPTELAQAFSIDIGFDGAGLLPTVGSCMILPLGNIKARITGAVIVANGVGTATIDLRLGTFSDAAIGATLAPIYGVVGNTPTMSNAAGAVLNTNTWTLNLQPADVLIATLVTVTSAITSPGIGALTCVTLSMYCRRLKWPAGGTALLDGGGNNVVVGGGAIVSLRS